MLVTVPAMLKDEQVVHTPCAPKKYPEAQLVATRAVVPDKAPVAKVTQVEDVVVVPFAKTVEVVIVAKPTLVHAELHAAVYEATQATQVAPEV